MSATFDAPIGVLPVLQYCLPAQLQIDPSYQRSIENGESKTLIKAIASKWDWGLCQPLVVARRGDGSLFVIDGQHRLEAAKLRGDIAQLPCVVSDSREASAEAAQFVALNRNRRPLAALDVFRASLASGADEAHAILAALEAAGLSLAPHSNHTAWKPGMVSNIGGIERAWKRLGAAVTTRALELLAKGFEGQVLRYAGTIFPGLVGMVVDNPNVADDMIVNALKRKGQPRIFSAILTERAASGDGMQVAGCRVLSRFVIEELAG
jgi:hypothetical protein